MSTINITDKSGKRLLTQNKYCPENIDVIPVLEERTITKNGIINPSPGYCGIKQMTVNVPNPSTGDLSVATDGTYNVVEKATVTVGVLVPTFETLLSKKWGTISE